MARRSRLLGGGSGWSDSYNNSAKGRRARYSSEIITDFSTDLPF